MFRLRLPTFFYYRRLDKSYLTWKSGDRKILIDTCVEETGFPDYIHFEINVKFLDDLAKAGYPHESIDTLMCSLRLITTIGRMMLIKHRPLLPV